VKSLKKKGWITRGAGTINEKKHIKKGEAIFDILL